MGKRIVGEDVGAALSGRKVIEDDHRYDIEREFLRSRQATMPGHDVAVAGHQQRSGETVLDDAAGDLRHLGIRVGARILGVGLEPIQRPQLDAAGHGRGEGSRHR